MADKIAYPKLGITRNATESLRAAISKLVRDPTSPRRGSGAERQINLSRDAFERLSRATGQDVIDADSVFQVLPDTELANQILCGSILSPKDMSTVELNFKVEDHLFDAELARPLLQIVEDHFKVDYKIDERLDGVLKEILFTKGAYILAVIPENNVDHLINSGRHLGLEHFTRALRNIERSRPMGILGHPREERLSMESYNPQNDHHTRVEGTAKLNEKHTLSGTVPGLSVSDNFDLLKVPNIRRKKRNVTINNLLKRHHVSMESASQGIAKGMSPEDIDKLYRPVGGGMQPSQVIVPQAYLENPSVGHPLAIKLPVESVIPVYVPGDPSDHIGYFVMLDQNGRPVVREEGKDYYGELRNNFRANTLDNTSEMVRQVKEAMGGVSVKSDLEFEQIQDAYTAIVENDLVNRLRNGVYQEELSIGTSEELMRIMLYRSFKAKQTQLLYIPAELVVYMAFSYNNHGIGQTLLTRSKILSSMRSVLLFAETMSGVRNAIGRKKASITVDPQDPDPQKTISDVQGLVLESSHRGFPLGSPDPAQTLDYLNRAGWDFNINIDSEDYPTTRVEFDDYNTQVNAGNQELADRLRRMHIAGMGLSPDWVDPQQSPEFATSVVNNNLLMTRRVLQYQKPFTEFLSKFVRRYTQYSSVLRGRLLKAIEGKKSKLAPELKDLSDEEIIDTFISSITAHLPAPDTTKLDLQLQAFEQYTNLLDRALEAYITPDLFPVEVMGSDRAGELQQMTLATIRAYYQRVWLSQNNIMPELDQLVEMNGKKPAFSLLDIQAGQFEGLGGAIHEYVEGIKKVQEKWVKKYGGSEGDGDDFGGGTSDELPDETGGVSDDPFGSADTDAPAEDGPFSEEPDALGETNDVDDEPAAEGDATDDEPPTM